MEPAGVTLSAPERPIAVLDADVLYPPILRDTMVSMAYRGLFDARWSDEVFAEVERNLISKANLTAATARARIEQLNRLLPDALVKGYASHLEGLTNHPKDRHLVAAAIKRQATFIVTRNLKDFRPLPPGITALHPDTFMCSLVVPENIEVLLDCFHDVGDRWPEPPTIEHVLGRLDQFAPRFVAMLSEAPED